MTFRNNQIYDILKTLALVVLPPLEALVIGLGEVWGIPVMAKVGATIALFATFLGAVLINASKAFHQEQEKILSQNDTGENQLLMAEAMLEEDEAQMVKGE